MPNTTRFWVAKSTFISGPIATFGNAPPILPARIAAPAPKKRASPKPKKSLRTGIYGSAGNSTTAK
jgi:hypothetical protein